MSVQPNLKKLRTEMSVAREKYHFAFVNIPWNRKPVICIQGKGLCIEEFCSVKMHFMYV